MPFVMCVVWWTPACLKLRALPRSLRWQTVILDHYERQVDSMLDRTQELNRGIERGDTDRMDRKTLYNALTRVNDISIQVIMSGLRNKYVPLPLHHRPRYTMHAPLRQRTQCVVYNQVATRNLGVERGKVLQHATGASATFTCITHHSGVVHPSNHDHCLSFVLLVQTLWEQYELEERYEQLEGKVNYITEVIKCVHAAGVGRNREVVVFSQLWLCNASIYSCVVDILGTGMPWKCKRRTSFCDSNA